MSLGRNSARTHCDCDADRFKVYADDCLVTRVKENPVRISSETEPRCLPLTFTGLHRGDPGQGASEETAPYPRYVMPRRDRGGSEWLT
jgi:hypothetical protein